MKKFLKILGIVVAVLLVVFLVFVFISYKQSGVVLDVMEASYAYTAENGSLEGFCDHAILDEARDSSYEVECVEDGGSVLLGLESYGVTYLCRNGVAGLNEAGEPKRGIVCVQADRPSR